MSLKVPLQNETVWLSAHLMSELFDRDEKTIYKHIKNVFEEQEVEEKSNSQNLRLPNSDKPVVFYSLDVIISVGYRVKSKRGVEFRKWANSVLKQYIMNGYAENLLIPCDLVLKVICLVMKKINLLYYIVKNHSFSDGNKRIAAAVFLYFLDKNNWLFTDGKKRLADNTLVALTIMIAESKPEEKEIMINLVMNFLI